MADMLRVRLDTSGWVGGPGLNTFYFTGAAGESAEEGDAGLCYARVRTCSDDIKAMYPPSWTAHTQGEVAVINSVTGALVNAFTVEESPVVHGVGAEDYGPTPVMLVNRLLTAGFVNGRQVKGRQFWGPYRIGDTTGGVPSQDVIDIVNDAVPALAVVGGGPFAFCVWHRPVGGAGGSAHLVTSQACSRKFGVLRSRRD